MNKCIVIAAWLLHAVALAAAPGDRARAVLAPFEGGQAAGTVELIQRGDTVQVLARLHGLPPGLHAFHLHAHGDCASAAGTGGHHDPAGAGARSEHHGGEFGALFADEHGQASLNLLVTTITLAPGGGPRSVVRRSIVVHSSPDDFAGWPARTRGVTLACGVVHPA
jgi:Cu-Zn family superoxide dismutase